MTELVSLFNDKLSLFINYSIGIDEKSKPQNMNMRIRDVR